MTGRPTILTEDLINRICKHISKGNYLETAARSCGIDDSTIRKWRIKGQALLDGDSVTDIDDETKGIYTTFVTAIKKAQAESEIVRLDRIAAAAIGGALIRRTTTQKKGGDVAVVEQYASPQWQADGWSLERTMPDKYGQKTRTDVTVTEPIVIVTKRIGDPRKEKDGTNRGNQEAVPERLHGEEKV